MIMNLCPRLRGRPRCQQAAISRDDIIEQAFIAFAQQGYEGVSLRQLATICGVSDSLLHHHFGSKHQLWQQAADTHIAPLMNTLSSNLEQLAQSHHPASALQQNLPKSLKNMIEEF